MKNVLLPFDGSEAAIRALEYVIGVKQGGSSVSVHLLNVQEAPRIFGDYASADLLEKLNRGARAQGQEINSRAAKILTDNDVPFTVHEAIGEVSQTIAEAADEFGCDTIIMGTRGMTNLANLMMGSVATRVVHEASVPVLLVK
ncbi:universal stress protein [Marinobacter pelagius]|uniref:universal stress protein n=1 Tax=Marinobacter sp. C7 TaxID=2951363 RepID=UPI001EF0CDE4|nr:universal stress protein [Marinobacter sp. C7]MCG7200247.1 universal stress protein [Marinobacter sp. C7]